MKRCARCQAAISSSELVMRARELVFHVHCFTCAVCSAPLTKGDTFGMRDGAVFCRLHYAELPPLSPAYHVPIPPSEPPPHFAPPEFHPRLGGGPHPTPPPPPPPDHPIKMAAANSFFNGGGPPAPRQKGRPRKRKPKDLDGLTTNLGELTFPKIW
ncbi:Hypothetical protein NTJ_15227 [Nesidiocoris tenuis]|uniref:LIM zinc-binding domain-containing protein n=1 Tax=Nesidiocoris tenuis TaxID=355587 RepID=A0ABN7BDS3_9HEMI|nr:Hypothetical protein NTJ_15227 [Nesidiocoris tenuis]